MDLGEMEEGKEKQRRGQRKEKATERPKERERGLQMGCVCLKVSMGAHSSHKRGAVRVHGILM